MIDLYEHAKQAQEIAYNRWLKKGTKYNTKEILKHCAGEVCEAVEAYNDFLYTRTNTQEEERREALAGELADIITCALIAAANEEIDIEKALQHCQEKNAKRAVEGSK